MYTRAEYEERSTKYRVLTHWQWQVRRVRFRRALWRRGLLLHNVPYRVASLALQPPFFGLPILSRLGRRSRLTACFRASDEPCFAISPFVARNSIFVFIRSTRYDVARTISATLSSCSSARLPPTVSLTTQPPVAPRSPPATSVLLAPCLCRVCELFTNVRSNYFVRSTEY